MKNCHLNRILMIQTQFLQVNRNEFTSSVVSVCRVTQISAVLMRYSIKNTNFISETICKAVNREEKNDPRSGMNGILRFEKQKYR